MSKRFGQNFLVHRPSRLRILDLVQASVGANVWEIGPGIGSMTALALDSGLALTAFEIDYGFARLLKRLFGGRSNFALVEGDFIDTWRAELEASPSLERALQRGPERIFGNLPYNAASSIVASIIEGGLRPARMVFTVQREGALRMTARPGTKDYSAFSVLCSSAFATKIAFDLGAGCFWPAPRVQSSVVLMVPRTDPLEDGDRAGFSAFVRAAFSSRRKTLRNNLRDSEAEILPEVLAELALRADVRAEALAPEELAEVYERLRRAAPSADESGSRLTPCQRC
jgi:16S rRNA (adenine1518-N6/adenine1519-N6)-dimethyltransferase